MIVFEYIRWRNFLSTGDYWSEIQLSENKSTLIIGDNGAGKSTILDALSFALFGKPHRNINKPQLVNSINNKNCSVEVEFSIGKSRFKVVRGMKPQVFEIWKNGNLINQDSHAKEYQKILEQNIIKLNHKSFHQIVVLGSSNFIPFMQLSAQHRRDVIEDLLDINVFSKMNTILKEKISLLKDQIKDSDYKIEILRNKISLQKNYIQDLVNLNEEVYKEKEIEIERIQNDIDALQQEIEESKKFIDEHEEIVRDDLAKAKKKREEISEYQHSFKQQIRNVVKDTKFYQDNESCPTCSQSIGEDLRRTKLETAQQRAQELQKAMDHSTEESARLEQIIQRNNELMDKVQEHATHVYSNHKQITGLQRQIRDLQDSIETKKETNDLSVANKTLRDLMEEKDQISEEKSKLSEVHSYNTVMSEMLKDTGIKTKVIKQYIPVINNLVNQYLQTLDFFVHFHLDEEFKETIRSRHRDSFSYDSFSEGEKQRIDLALLFTWRMIAKMKNSVATNLLVLDETFDSSLDHDGVENLMKILYTLDSNTNVFVISHKGDILDSKFVNKLKFMKDKNFSRIKKLS